MYIKYFTILEKKRFRRRAVSLSQTVGQALKSKTFVINTNLSLLVYARKDGRNVRPTQLNAIVCLQHLQGSGQWSHKQ